MSDTKLTDELKLMNAYWRLLAGLVNEGLGIVHDERLSPEARLEQIREKLEFAQRYTRELPPSVRAELDADPRMQAAMNDMIRRHTGSGDEGDATERVMGDDGAFHDVVAGPESDVRPVVDDEIQELLQENDEA